MILKMSFMWRLELILALAILFFKIIVPMPAFVSFFYFITFFIGIFMSFLLLRGAEKAFLAMLFFSVIFPFAAILLSVNMIGIKNLSQYFYLISAILFIFISHRITIDSKTRRMSYLVALFAGVIILFRYFMMPKEYMVNSLLLGFSNPNEAGVWIAGILLLQACSSRGKKHSVFGYMLRVAMVVMLFYLLFMTQCRSALLAILLFYAGMGLSHVLKKDCRNIKLHKIVTSLICLLPILVAIVYFAINSTNIVNYLGFMADRGKTLSSRIGVWSQSIEDIAVHPIIGNYSEYSGAGFQSHNAYLHIALFYGIPVLLILVFFIGGSIYRDSRTNGNLLFYAAMMSLMLISSFEAFMVSGNTGVAILYFSALMLARGDGLLTEKAAR